MEEKDFSDKKALRRIREYEAQIDEKLALGAVAQEVAWDCYFSLLHECDLRWFWEDRNRIIKKIDTKRYNPFLSKDPDVVRIAQIRAEG